MTASTLTPDSRPWWQVMQRPLGPVCSMVTPDGSSTESIFKAAGLWQVMQVTTVPVGAGLSTTPAWVPSSPR